MKREITNEILQEFREQITEEMKKGNSLYSFYYEELSKQMDGDKLTIVFNISNAYNKYIEKNFSEMNLRRSELSEEALETFADIYYTTFLPCIAQLLCDVKYNTDYENFVFDKFLAVFHNKNFERIARDADDCFYFYSKDEQMIINSWGDICITDVKKIPVNLDKKIAYLRFMTRTYGYINVPLKDVYKVK